MTEATSVKHIEITVVSDDKGTMKLANAMDKMKTSIDRTANSMSTIKNAFMGYLGILSVRELANMSDEFQLLNDRMSVLAGGHDKGAEAFDKLRQVAIETKSSVAASAETYNRLAITLGRAGATTDQLVEVTKVLNNSFRLAGSSVAESTGTIIQFAQAMSSGQLRGQELRTVMEQNGVLAQIFAKHANDAGQSVYKMAEQGKFTADVVFKLLADNMDKINEGADKMGYTFGQAVTMGLDSAKNAIMHLNQEFNLSQKFYDGIKTLADNINVLAKAVAVLGAVISTVKIGGWILAIVADFKKAESLLGGIMLFLGIASPYILGIAVAVGALGVAWAFLGQEIRTETAAEKRIREFQGIEDTARKAAYSVEDLARASAKMSSQYEARKQMEEGSQSVMFDTTAGKTTSVDAAGGFLSKISQMDFSNVDNLKKTISEIDSPIQHTTKSANELVRSLGDLLKDAPPADAGPYWKLNSAFLANKMTLAEYNKEVKKVGIEHIDKEFKKGADTIAEHTEKVEKLLGPYRAANELLREGRITQEQYWKEVQKVDLKKLNKEWKDNTITFDDFKEKQKKVIGEFSELNTALDNHTITLAQYQAGVDKLNTEEARKQWKKGATDLDAFQSKIGKFRDLNNSVNSGSMSIKQYRTQTNIQEVEEINRKFREGKISLDEYHSSIVKVQNSFSGSSALYAGTNDFLQKIGTVSSNVSDMVSNTFQRLEDSLMTFIKNGEFNFKQFTQAILDDLTRIILRAAIIRPLAEGIIGGIGSLGGGTGPKTDTSGGGAGMRFSGSNASVQMASAHGNIFEGGLHAFAQGGIVSAPTLFKYGSGSNGLMGEAGPEAIIPLTRGSDGNLGVRNVGGSAKAPPTIVEVNVTNNSKAEVSVEEKTDSSGRTTIELLIQEKVKEGIATGKFDRVMNSAYGVSRKGVR